MVERPLEPRRGGFKRRIRLGVWIRDTLSSGLEFYALQLWGMYKIVVEVEREERARVRRKKLPKARPITYAGFRAYLYTLRELGLIEYTGRTGMAETKGGEPAEHLAERRYFKANLDKLDHIAWLDPMASYPRREERG